MSGHRSAPFQREDDESRERITGLEILITGAILMVLAVIVRPTDSHAAEPDHPPSLAAIDRAVSVYGARFGVLPSAEQLERPPTDRQRGMSFGPLIDTGLLPRVPTDPSTGLPWTTDAWLDNTRTHAELGAVDAESRDESPRRPISKP